MKALRKRQQAPAGWDDPERIRGFYDDAKARQELPDRWNEPRKDGTRPLRDHLSALSDGCCAWCNRALTEGWTVDHYLPKSAFPRLAYCWHNLLPSCRECNTRRKRDYRPPALDVDSLIDPLLESAPPAIRYDPAVVLGSIHERLVEPTFDEPAQHLKFEAAINSYQAITEIGQATCKRFFAEKSDAVDFEDLGSFVKYLIQTNASDAEFERLSRLIGGRMFYIEAYRRFWADFFPSPEGPPAPPAAPATAGAK